MFLSRFFYNEKYASILAFMAMLLTVWNIPTGLLAVFIVATVTLRCGVKQGGMVLFWAAIPFISLLIMKDVSQNDVEWCLAAVMFLSACMMRSGYDRWPQVLALFVSLGLVIVLGVHFLVPNVEHFWLAQMKAYFEASQYVARFHDPAVQAHLNLLSQYATGLVVTFGEISVFVLLVLALGLEARRESRGGEFSSYFMMIRTPYVLSLLLLLGTIGLFFHLSWVLAIYPVLLLPCILSGLSFVHAWIHRRTNTFIWFFVFYLLLLVFTMLLLILAIIGWLDSWFNFRKRFHHSS